MVGFSILAAEAAPGLDTSGSLFREHFDRYGMPGTLMLTPLTEVEQWLRNCGFPVTTTNQTSLAGSTPSPTQGPAATGVFVGSLTTATYTYTEIDNDDDDDDAPETETRTTVFPVGVWTSGTFTGSYGSLTTSTATYTVQDDDDDVSPVCCTSACSKRLLNADGVQDNDSETITRTLVFPVGATPVVPGVNTATQTQSVSYTTGTTTDAQGNTQVVTSPATTFDGAAAIATAGPLLGAGMAVMLAGIGFGI